MLLDHHRYHRSNLVHREDETEGQCLLQLVVYSLLDDLKVISYQSKVAVFHMQFPTLPEQPSKVH